MQYKHTSGYVHIHIHKLSKGFLLFLGHSIFYTYSKKTCAVIRILQMRVHARTQTSVSSVSSSCLSAESEDVKDSKNGLKMYVTGRAIA